MAKSFYMVWNEGNRSPTHKHETYNAAKTEAERLCRVATGNFYVLQAVSVSRRVDVETESLDRPALDDQIPF